MVELASAGLGCCGAAEASQGIVSDDNAPTSGIGTGVQGYRSHSSAESAVGPGISTLCNDV